MKNKKSFFNTHKVVGKFNYELEDLDKGYNNRTLYINISNNTIFSKPVSEKIKKLFIGGKGFDLWLILNMNRGKIDTMHIWKAI